MRVSQEEKRIRRFDSAPSHFPLILRHLRLKPARESGKVITKVIKNGSDARESSTRALWPPDDLEKSMNLRSSILSNTPPRCTRNETMMEYGDS